MMQVHYYRFSFSLLVSCSRSYFSLGLAAHTLWQLSNTFCVQIVGTLSASLFCFRMNAYKTWLWMSHHMNRCASINSFDQKPYCLLRIFTSVPFGFHIQILAQIFRLQIFSAVSGSLWGCAISWNYTAWNYAIIAEIL